MKKNTKVLILLVAIFVVILGETVFARGLGGRISRPPRTISRPTIPSKSLQRRSIPNNSFQNQKINLENSSGLNRNSGIKQDFNKRSTMDKIKDFFNSNKSKNNTNTKSNKTNSTNNDFNQNKYTNNKGNAGNNNYTNGPSVLNKIPRDYMRRSVSSNYYYNAPNNFNRYLSMFLLYRLLTPHNRIYASDGHQMIAPAYSGIKSIIPDIILVILIIAIIVFFVKRKNRTTNY